MNNRREHAVPDDLLAAYAIDAVEPDEARDIETHLPGCRRCRTEVARYRETAALLVDGTDEPPDLLWERIAAKITEQPRPLDVARLARPRAARWRDRMLPAVAAAAAVLAVALGGVVVAQDRRLDRMQAALAQRTMAAAALAALDDPAARDVELRSGDGQVRVRAVLLPDGTGYLFGDSLAPLPAQRTYQLWAVVGADRVSAGVLGPDPGVVAFHVDPAAVAALAVTEERAGGVVTTAKQPLVAGVLTA